MKFPLALALLFALALVGPLEVSSSARLAASPAPSPRPPRPALAPRTRRSPKPAVPALIVPVIITAASNPLVVNTVRTSAQLVGRFGTSAASAVANAARSTFSVTRGKLLAIFEKIKSSKTAAADTTALVSSAAVPTSSVTSGLAQEGGPKKSKIGTVVSGIVKGLELTGQAANVGLSVASAVHLGQLNQASTSVSSDASKQCSVVATSNICVASPSLNTGGFTLGSSLKITWIDKSPNCRDSIKNIADQRPSYLQNLPQFANSANLNFQLQSHRQAVVNCGNTLGLPKISLAPGIQRISKPSKVGSIPHNLSQRTTVLAWKGLNWFTDKVKNSCTLDSFLTFMILKGKLDSSYTKRNFLVPQSPAEAILTEIINQYRKLPFTLSVPNQKLANQNFKQLWIKTFNPQFKNHLASDSVIDYVGSELTNVIEHLSTSATMFLSMSCKCQENNAQKISVKKIIFKSVDLTELKKIAWPAKDTSISLNEPAILGFHRQYRSSCKACVSDLKVDYIFVPTSTWVLYFMFSPSSLEVINVFQVPKLFVALEMFLYNQDSTFELGYISCVTTTAVNNVFHHLSFQYFNSKFYYYDDLKGGELILSPDPNLTIKVKKLKVEAVVYFRP